MWIRRASRWSWFGCAWCFALGGCGGLSLLDFNGSSDAVYIVGTEGLSPPAVPTASLYHPDIGFPIDPEDLAAGRAVGFFVKVSTTEGPQVQMRLLQGADTPSVPLRRIAALPASATEASPWALPREARNSLRDGQGVFWSTEFLRFGQGEYRLGVVLPDTWSGASVSLEVYVDTTGSGDPLRSDRIELARDFFYMSGVGDSLMWGNGLPDARKFFTLVADEIQRRTGKRVVRSLHAISATLTEPSAGDVICPLTCTGEVPTSSTSISTQIDQLEAPTQLNLVLMDGCINEVGTGNILLPETDDAALAAFTQHVCYTDMLGLLRKVRAASPQATIVLTGYYAIMSPETRLPDTLQLFIANRIRTSAQGDELIAAAATQSKIFVDNSRAALIAAAEQAYAESGNSVVLFVDPAFTDANAVFASDPLLWGLTASRSQSKAGDAGFTLFPEDPMADLRASGCFESNVLVDPITCLYGSVGHPNLAGARRYAQVILSALEEKGVIPPATP